MTISASTKEPPLGIRVYIAATGAAIVYLLFAWKKAFLGIDFTDEGLYAAAPLRLMKGEPLFSSEIMTLVRPFEIVSQVFYRIAGTPSLYQLRLSGWVIHIAAYLALFFALYRACQTIAVALFASAIAFFVSFAWPATIATPGYKSLSTDFLLFSLSLFFLARRRADALSARLCIASGLAMLMSVICYPPLVLLCPAFLAYELRQLGKGSACSPWEKTRRLTWSITTASAAFLLVAFFCFSGAASRWLIRIDLVHSFSLTSIKSGGLAFYAHLFGELFTKTIDFKRYTVFAAAVAGFCLLAPRPQLVRWRAPVLTVFHLVSLYTMVCQYRGPTYVGHFFFSTAFCLISVTAVLVHAVLETRSSPRTNSAALFCMAASLAAGLIYATSTYFFDYYYSWNSGLLGFPFMFSFLLGIHLTEQYRRNFVSAVMIALGLAYATAGAALFNYSGIRRDAELPNLSATFRITPLRGIKSAPDRVSAVEALHAYLGPKLTGDRELLAYDDCPMLYFVLDAKPVYGLTWAVRRGIAEPVLKQLTEEFLHRPLPPYAVRTLIDLSEPDWTHAPPASYSNTYPLNAAVESRYERETVIYPFEVLKLRAPRTQTP
jgi:hypothetical protein